MSSFGRLERSVLHTKLDCKWIKWFDVSSWFFFVILSTHKFDKTLLSISFEYTKLNPCNQIITFFAHIDSTTWHHLSNHALWKWLPSRKQEPNKKALRYFGPWRESQLFLNTVIFCGASKNRAFMYTYVYIGLSSVRSIFFIIW